MTLHEICKAAENLSVYEMKLLVTYVTDKRLMREIADDKKLKQELEANGNLEGNNG